MSGSVTVKATRFPSGETWTAPTVFTFIISSGVHWARNERVKKNAARIHRLNSVFCGFKSNLLFAISAKTRKYRLQTSLVKRNRGEAEARHKCPASKRCRGFRFTPGAIIFRNGHCRFAADRPFGTGTNRLGFKEKYPSKGLGREKTPETPENLYRECKKA